MEKDVFCVSTETEEKYSEIQAELWKWFNRCAKQRDPLAMLVLFYCLRTKLLLTMPEEIRNLNGEKNFLSAEAEDEGVELVLKRFRKYAEQDPHIRIFLVGKKEEVELLLQNNYADRYDFPVKVLKKIFKDEEVGLVLKWLNKCAKRWKPLKPYLFFWLELMLNREKVARAGQYLCKDDQLALFNYPYAEEIFQERIVNGGDLCKEAQLGLFRFPNAEEMLADFVQHGGDLCMEALLKIYE